MAPFLCDDEKVWIVIGGNNQLRGLKIIVIISSTNGGFYSTMRWKRVLMDTLGIWWANTNESGIDEILNLIL